MSAHKILQELYLDGAPQEIYDPGDAGTLRCDRQFATYNLTSGSVAQTRTLPDPKFAGQRLLIALKTDGGADITITASSAIDEPGTTSIVLGDVGDFIDLVGVNDGASAFAWRILASAGIATQVVDASVVVMRGATGENEIRVPGNLNDALSIESNTADLIAFNTNTSSPAITVTPATTVTGAMTLNGGLSMGTTANISLNVNTNNATDILVSNNVNRSLAIKSAAADIIAVNTTATPSVTITPATTITGALTSSAGITLADNMNVTVQSTTGSRLGNNVSKLGFFGVTPVVSQTNCDNVANDGNSNINTVIQAVNLLAAAMRNLGFIGVT